MAIKPADNETFYREVDEELRRDQMKNVWSRYGVLIIGGALLLIGAIGGYIYYEHHQRVTAEAHGEELSQIYTDIGAGKVKEVGPKLDALAADGGPGYRAAALLTKADLALEAGDDKAALAAFKAVADDGKIAQPYRELALIRQTSLEFDTLPPADVIARLKPLAVAGNPWFATAGELSGIAHLKAGQQAEAAKIFAAMTKDDTIPSTVRSRALQMAGALGVDAIDDKAAAGMAAPKGN